MSYNGANLSGAFLSPRLFMLLNRENEEMWENLDQPMVVPSIGYLNKLWWYQCMGTRFHFFAFLITLHGQPEVTRIIFDYIELFEVKRLFWIFTLGTVCDTIVIDFFRDIKSNGLLVVLISFYYIFRAKLVIDICWTIFRLIQIKKCWTTYYIFSLWCLHIYIYN